MSYAGFRARIQQLGFLGLNVKNKIRVWVLIFGPKPCNQLVGFCKQVGLGV